MIAIDLDGTLIDDTHIEHLLDVDLAHYHYASLNAPVNEHVRVFTNEQAVLLTHREEQWRPLTTAWLHRHGIAFDRLVMRPAGEPDRAWQWKVQWMLDNNIHTIIEDNGLTIEHARRHGLRAIHVHELMQHPHNKREEPHQ